MAETFRITLRDADGYDGLESREFDLAVGTTFPIGRASSNSVKPHLSPARHNAYINSPVISREHAVLSASADTGFPQVFITDTNSMHGTMVNGRRLEPNTPKPLALGDLIQFGVDVNRNEEFHVARKYTFESRLSRPFSMGFTVPDSEEEDVGIVPRRGSQHNPLTVDESDLESDTSGHEQADMTMTEEPSFLQHEKPVAVVHVPLPYQDYPESALRSTAMEEDYSEDGGGSLDYPSEGEEEEMPEDDPDSAASIMGSSDADYNSEPEISEDEAKEPADTAEHKSISTSEPEQSLPALEKSSGTSLPAFAPRDMPSASASFEHPAPNAAPELPSIGLFRPAYNNNVWTDSYPPPLPPRPSAARSSLFGRPELPSFPQQSDQQAWNSEDIPTYPSYMGTNHGDRQSFFSPAPVSTMSAAQEAETAAPIFGGHSASFAPISDRIQTPPAMPMSDVVGATPPPPTRRTGVSITEIVEEQPLTPTSINSMKRKADVLEEEEETHAVEEPVVVSVEVASAEHVPIEVANAQMVAMIAQRPKVQPRSIISKLKNTASYIGYGAMGAAGAFALLATVPDAFFT